MYYNLQMYPERNTELLILNDTLPEEFGGVGPRGHGQTYTDLLDHYRDTSWGADQDAQPPRYSGNFGYDPEAMLRDFGESVHPLQHNTVAHHDYQGFLIQALLLSDKYDMAPKEIVASRLAAQFHDTGEATHEDLRTLCGGVVGDIPSGEKTPEHRATERRVLEKVLDTMVTNLPRWLKTEAVRIIVHDPAVTDGLPHRLFEAAHNWGEYETGITAGVLAMDAIATGEEGLRARQLARIGTTVVPKVLGRLEPEIADLPFIEPMLGRYSATHDRIMTELAPGA